MTDIQKVRLLIGDNVVPYHFTDAEIQAFLDMADDSLYEAAALALEAWAATLTSDVESEHIGDYSYSKRASANKLDLAARYRKNNAEIPQFDIASMDLTGSSDEDEEDV